MKKLLATVIVLAVIAGGLYLAFRKGMLPAGGGGLDVPVRIVGADGVITLQIEMNYDPDAARAVAVNAGPLAPFLQSSLATPGRVVIGIVNDDGMKGDGEAARIRFERLKKGEPVALKVAPQITAHEAETRYRLAPTATDGLLPERGEPTPVVVRFGRR